MSTNRGHRGDHPQGSEDAEQASWLAIDFDHKVKFDHTAGKWHRWDGIRWKVDGKRDVQEAATEFTYERMHGVVDKHELTKEQAAALIKIYRRLLEKGRLDSALVKLSELAAYKTDGSDWDQEPTLLGVANGIVDLTTNRLIDHPGPGTNVTLSTGLPFTRPVGSSAEWPDRIPKTWKFLLEVTSYDEELAAFLLLWFGYSLFGLTQEPKFLVMTGHGRNGKGVLANLMRHVFGEYTAKAHENLYMKHRFGAARADQARSDLMELKGKRLAIMSEPDGGAFDENLLKAHTGSDQPITARALNSNNVLTWMPTHTITFLTNLPPSVEDVGPSMTSRVMVADFREQWSWEGQCTEECGPEPHVTCRHPNKRLYDELKAESEDILAVLIHAAYVWCRTPGGLVLPKRIIDASSEYVKANDPIGRALDEAFTREPGAKAAGKALYDAYMDWFTRSEADGDPITATRFGIALAKAGFKKVRGERGVVYEGIRPASAVEVAEREVA